MRRLLFLALIAGSSASAQSAPELAVIPRPTSMTPGRGTFRLTAQTTIVATRADSLAARRLARDLAPATGWDLPVRFTAVTSGNRIVFRRAAKTDTTLGSEGYTLDVKPGVVTITSSAAAGAFYGVQSFRQLLPAAIFRSAPVEGVAWTAPAVAITDRPRFQWRGMHLDAARHFMPKEFVKKYIDLLALHKLNTFHWHLTDDQGWRLEIKKYPRLTSVGAWRKETLIGRPNGDTSRARFDAKPHGGFYTQDDAREIVAYAKERFIRVVPEIEMPGHSQAAIAAYPWLNSFDDTVGVWTQWGVTRAILNPTDSTIAFMKDVLTEVMAIFPSEYIHVGGDEASKQWEPSARAQARLKELGLENVHALQSWFIRQMDTFLTANGRRLVGWDEILEGGLAEGAVVMSWRGIAGGVAAARASHDVVMAPGQPTYFDHYQTRNTGVEPLAIGGFNPIDSVYAYDPIPKELEPRFAKHILGAQAQLWTEYMEGPKNVEFMAFPRAAALAEALWTAPARKNFADFSARLAPHLDRLQALDVNFRRPDPPRTVP